MSKINRKKRRHVIHVSIRSTSEKNIQQKHIKSKLFSSDITCQQSNIISHNKLNVHDQQDFTPSSFPTDLNQEYESQHSINIDKRNMISNKQDRSILGVNCRIIPNEQNISSISNINSKNKNINRVTPSLEISSIFEKQKDFILTNTNSNKKRERKCFNLPLWLLMLLIYSLLVLLATIAAITIGILTTFKEKSSSTSTSTITTTSSTSATDTTTTTTVTTTTTTYYTCSNYSVKAKWDYSGNDVVSNGPMTFASCCAWCLNLTICAAFTFNPWNSCLIKNSIGTGGVSYPNLIGVAR